MLHVHLSFENATLYSERYAQTRYTRRKRKLLATQFAQNSSALPLHALCTCSDHDFVTYPYSLKPACSPWENNERVIPSICMLLTCKRLDTEGRNSWSVDEWSNSTWVSWIRLFPAQSIFCSQAQLRSLKYICFILISSVWREVVTVDIYFLQYYTCLI